MVEKYIYFGMSVFLPLAGCVGQGGTGMPVPRPLGRDVPSFHASSDAVASPVESDTVSRQDTITLRQALGLALMNSPELAVHSWGVRAAEARILQSKVFPNPEIEVGIEGFGGSGETEGFDSAVTSIVLSQAVELGGKRARRRRAAMLELESAAWEYEAKRLDVLTETTQRFIDVLASQERVGLAELGFGIAGNAHEAVSERVKTGKDSPLDHMKSEGELASSRLTVVQAARKLAENRWRLAFMWGSSRPHFGRVVGSWPEMLKEIPDFEDIQKRLHQNPGMQRAALDVNLAKASLSAERAARIPDIALVAGIQRYETDEDDTYIVGVGVALPIFDQNQGGIREAEAVLEGARYGRKATEVTLQAKLRSAYETLVHARRVSAILANEVLPAAEKAFLAAEEGYRAGKLSYLDMLDARRVLFDGKVILLEGRAEYYKSLAELERLTGESLRTIGKNEEESE